MPIPVDVDQYLCSTKIIRSNETWEMLVHTIENWIVQAEQKFFSVDFSFACNFAKNIAERIFQGDFIPQTTILQNLSLCPHYPLSACAVPAYQENIQSVVDCYHEEGMGTGFNLDEFADPVQKLMQLNEIAREGAPKQNRPVGNIAILSVQHPKILEFIDAKKNDALDWKFNTSVNINDEFIQSIKNGSLYLQKIDAHNILYCMADAARQTGDPGWIHLNRFNRKNPVPKIGSYKAVAPCGEVAMLEGEACLFGYLNLGNCVKNNDVDYEKIRWITQLAIRFLDDALEQSIENYQNRTSAEIMEQNRKIGLGVCGWQDLLVQLQIPYGSTESLSLAQDIMSFVNFFSKQASVELSAIRGSFPNFVHSEYQHNHITQLFGNSDTKSIQKKDWCLLESSLLTKGIRHCSTTALPPTGRSSLIIGTSPQIEPYFYLNPGNKSNENFILYKEIQNYCSKQSMPKEKIEAMISKIKSKGSVQDIIPTPFSKIFRKATEISVQEHLNTVAAFQIYTDQGISKTINLLKNSSIEEIIDIYLLAYDLGLLGNTIYVDGSKAGQPQKL